MTSKLTNLNQLVNVNASMNTKTIHHIKDVLCSYVTGSSWSKGAATEARNRTVNYGDTLLQCDKNVCQTLTIGVVKMDCQLLFRHLCRDNLQQFFHLPRCSNTSCVSERHLV